MRLKGGNSRLASENSSGVFRELDEGGVQTFHIRTLIVSGMGFFTDAYDLFVIGALLPIIAIYFGISSSGLTYALISSSALFGAIIGPVVFGPIADRYGRKTVYAIDLAILIIAAIGSSFSANPTELIAWRFVLGIGVGGDYPVSATLMSEYSNRKDRGKLVSSVFAMQGFGLLSGALTTLICLWIHLPTDLVWRIPLALGAVPALAVIYARRKVAETPRFMVSSGKVDRDAADSLGILAGEQQNGASTFNIPKGQILSRYLPLILGTAISWFTLDVAFYGTSIFSNTIIHNLITADVTGGAASYAYLIRSTEITSLIFLFFAFPGYWAAVFLIDGIGRKKLQLLGFGFMVVAYAAIASIPGIVSNLVALFVVYGSTFFFINMGPNTTTFVVPVEVFPTQIRTTGHGIAASAGKVGASISAFLFPFALKVIHLSGVFAWLTIMGVLGLIVTAILIPEGQERRLEDISGEERLLKTYSEFSDLISGLTERIERAAVEMQSFVKNWGDADEEAKKVKAIESECDEIVHRIFVRLNTKFMAPINRMDIVSLTHELDDIMDYLEAASARFSMYEIRGPTQEMSDFMDIIVDCVVEVKRGIASINDIYSRRFDRIESSCIRINELENRGDEILRKTLKSLFANNDAKQIMKLKEIYDNLETVTDKCEDVADKLRDLIVEYRRK